MITHLVEVEEEDEALEFRRPDDRMDRLVELLSEVKQPQTLRQNRKENITTRSHLDKT